MRGTRVKQLRKQCISLNAEVMSVTGMLPKNVWRRFKREYVCNR